MAALLGDAVLLGATHERPACGVLIPAQCELFLLLDVAASDEERGVGAGAFPLEDHDPVHSACETDGAIDLVQGVGGSHLAQVVNDEYCYVVPSGQ